MARQHLNAVRRTGQLLAGLLALLTLIALLIGVPILLTELAGNPLPHTLPSLEQIGHALTARDNGELFLRALTVVAWGAWAAFALSVLVEIPAAIRRRPALRLPGLGLSQRAAAHLIAGVALMLHSPAMASAAAAVPVTAPTPPAAVSTVATPHHLDGLDTLHVRAAAGALPAPAHFVARTTTDRPQTSTPAAEPVYQVQRGDWLWHVADRFLGDPNRYTDIVELNPELEARDHRFPDHVEATWQLTLPADAQDRGPRAHAIGHLLTPPAPTTDAPATPAAEPTGPHGGGGEAGAGVGPAAPAPTTAPSTTPSTGAAPSASTTPSATVSPTGTASPAASTTASRAATDSTASTAGHEPRPADDDSALEQAATVGVPLLGAGLLSALLLTTLRRRRRRQEQHRPVGRRIPEPVGPQVETAARVVAQPIAVERLDHALRALGAALADRPAEQMPDVVGAWLEGETVNLLLTAACPNPPAPWIGDHLSWSLPGGSQLPDVDGQLAPLPALVAVGSQPGMHLLLDLERLGLLTITGDPDRAGDLLRYLAAELSCNAWSDHVEIVVAGFDAAETAELIALGGDRIIAAPTVAAAIERVRRRAGQVIQSVDYLSAGDPLVGRVVDIAGDAWMPHVLLANDPGPDDIAALEALDNDLADTGRCAVAVAATTRREVGRWPVSIDADGRLTITFLGMTGQSATLTAAGLPRVELGNLAELLSTARRGTGEASSTGEPDLPTGDWPAVPPATEPEPWAQGTDAAGGLLDELQDQQPAAGAEDEVDPSDDEAPAPSDETPASTVAVTAPQPEPAVQVPAPRATMEATRPVDEAARIPAVVVAAGRQAPAKRTTAQVRRRNSDPTLDADLQAWTEADRTRPRIAILGPVIVEAPGHLPAERRRFYAEIITYLAARGQRGATIDAFDEALWPGQQVKPTSRRVAVARARRWLGETPDGEAWLPDATGDRRYRLRDGYLLDWHLFRRLRSRGESRGPAGIADLRQALTLVRGAPLAGADVAYSSAARNPYVWLPGSDIQPHHIASAVVDTAHRLVELCLDGGDIPGARFAVDQAWLADPERASDIAWRDLLRVAAAEGNTAELDQLLGELMRVREAEVPEDLDKDTYRLLCELIPERMRVGAH